MNWEEPEESDFTTLGEVRSSTGVGGVMVNGKRPFSP